MGRIASALAVLTKSHVTSPKLNNEPTMASMVVSPQGRQGKPNAALYRNWAQNSDLGRALVNFFKRQVSVAGWDIVPYYADRPHDLALASRIRDIFDTPNLEDEGFQQFVEQVAEDLLVLDAGVVEIERTLRGEVRYLHAADGARVLVSTLWDGDPDEARYWWMRGMTDLVPMKNRDLLYIMTNPRTNSKVGLSMFETLKLTIDWELRGSSYNANQVTTATPDGVLNLGEGAKPEQIAAFRSLWGAEVAGRGAMGIIGGTKAPNFIPFRQGNREMQFIEWQNYLLKKACMVAGVSPQDIGFAQDINRSEGQVQQDISETKGLRPFMSTVQNYLTSRIVWDESFGGRKNNLAFRFARLNIQESTDKANINKVALAGVPWKSPNEGRLDEGRMPVGSLTDKANTMNHVLGNTPLGIFDYTDGKYIEMPQPVVPKVAVGG